MRPLILTPGAGGPPVLHVWGLPCSNTPTSAKGGALNALISGMRCLGEGKTQQVGYSRTGVGKHCSTSG